MEVDESVPTEPQKPADSGKTTKKEPEPAAPRLVMAAI